MNETWVTDSVELQVKTSEIEFYWCVSINKTSFALVGVGPRRETARGKKALLAVYVTYSREEQGFKVSSDSKLHVIGITDWPDQSLTPVAICGQNYRSLNAGLELSFTDPQTDPKKKIWTRVFMFFIRDELLKHHSTFSHESGEISNLTWVRGLRVSEYAFTSDDGKTLCITSMECQLSAEYQVCVKEIHGIYKSREIYYLTYSDGKRVRHAVHPASFFKPARTDTEFSERGAKMSLDKAYDEFDLREEKIKILETERGGRRRKSMI